MRIGIDLGGTKIEGILLASDGQERGRKRVATPRGDYPGTLQAILLLISELTPPDTQPTVGIGTPGALSKRTGRLKNANSTWLNGQPFQKDLEAQLGRKIRMSNDANCFALSEAVDGAGAEAESVFGVILGTGAGG
ncbi:MAG: ROK family protein, partial [Candidatus Eisenbacteria bacterium]|nr:ROK family protein [Candidatus Eisenbacteria bacterium]